MLHYTQTYIYFIATVHFFANIIEVVNEYFLNTFHFYFV